MTERSTDPYVGFRFRISLGHIEIVGAAKCTGLESEVKVFEYPEGGLNTHLLKFPERCSLKNITIKRGLTQSYDLYDWYLDVASGSFDHDNQRPAGSGTSGLGNENDQSVDKKISISLIDSSGETLKEWVLRRAFPVKWVGPEFKATDNVVAFESIELAHEGLERLN